MKPLLTVIMPCFNVEQTLKRAMDSVLMQVVDFPIEVIVINDSSTDGTYNIVREYTSIHPEVLLLNNDTNLGNAASFYKGLKQAQGKYFCVLDGDDYYTIPDKFQRQVDFLENDIYEEFCATCHHFVYGFSNGTVFVNDCGSIKEFGYTNIITQTTGQYYHTSTFMYRNIFQDNVPDFFSYNDYRGDTPRTTFHLLYSNKRVKVLNFVGSVYFYNNNGIWSSMHEQSQHAYQVKYLTTLKRSSKSDFEQRELDKQIERNRNLAATSERSFRSYSSTTIENCLISISKYAKYYAFREYDYVINGLYYSEYLDSLCASLGYMYREANQELIQTEVLDNHISIVISALNPTGGGIFREISELIEAFSDMRIQVLVTDMSLISQDVYDSWSKYTWVNIVLPSSSCDDKLAFFLRSQRDFKPKRIYFYCSHADVYAASMIQEGVAQNICFFSFDHGFILGLSNSKINKLIAKRPTDYYLLKKYFGNRVIYIPTWNKNHNCTGKAYKPYYKHNELITAIAAARFYKVNGGWPYRYTDIIIQTLKTTRGKHYHIGPIPENSLREIYELLDNAGICRDSFLHIPWVNNLPRFLLDSEVDLFVEPFPIVSYKITLDVLSVGIPIISFAGQRRMEILDFIYEGALKWKNTEDLLQQICTLSSEELEQHSAKSIDYYQRNHSFERIIPYIRDNVPFMTPQYIRTTDNTIVDVINMPSLFRRYPVISIMKSEQSIDEVDRIKTSESYRVGYCILFPFRYLIVILHISMNERCRRNIDRYKKTKAFHPIADDPAALLYAYKRSASWRIGKIALLPLRLLKSFYNRMRSRIH